MRKIAAPIDGKNVSTEWLYEIFDDFEAVRSGKQIIGYVCGDPVYAYWEDNKIFWKAVTDPGVYDVLKERLEAFEYEDSELFSEIYVFNGTIIQAFYWKM